MPTCVFKLHRRCCCPEAEQTGAAGLLSSQPPHGRRHVALSSVRQCRLCRCCCLEAELASAAGLLSSRPPHGRQHVALSPERQCRLCPCCCLEAEQTRAAGLFEQPAATWQATCRAESSAPEPPLPLPVLPRQHDDKSVRGVETTWLQVQCYHTNIHAIHTLMPK